MTKNILTSGNLAVQAVSINTEQIKQSDCDKLHQERLEEIKRRFFLLKNVLSLPSEPTGILKATGVP